LKGSKCTIIGERINGRVDDGDDGNPIRPYFHESVSSASHCAATLFDFSRIRLEEENK